MADLDLQVAVTRPQLALPDLDINDHLRFYIGQQFLGGGVAWNRNQVTSPWLDGAVTTHRSRQMVSEQIQVEVLGDTKGEMQANIAELVRAFIQDSFVLVVSFDDANFNYACEAADYQIVWSGPRFIARQAQVALTVPRQPVPLTGVI